tara:strand:- start:59724 stop:60041 length:318 start_codon:yes stop_codon:yes gene_type:complete
MRLTKNKLRRIIRESLKGNPSNFPTSPVNENIDDYTKSFESAMGGKQYSYSKKLGFIEAALASLEEAKMYDDANADIDDDWLIELIDDLRRYMDALHPMVDMERQ